MNEELFDLSEKYEAMLREGIRLSGEDQHFFIRGRIDDLRTQLPSAWAPRRILDFGCGTGHSTHYLASVFPQASVLGVDTAEKALERAKSSYASTRVRFASLREPLETTAYDLCYTNGVFHHIDPRERSGAIRSLYAAMAPDGYLAFFENNPWNPGTRLVMRRIPFDRDAVPLSSREAKKLAKENGFGRIRPTRYLFYFPRFLSFLRFSESWLARLPLGAQYCVLAQK